MAEATEVALVLAQLVSDHRAFPDEAARDLHRMLGHRITVPSPGELRYDRLQLLLTMMLDDGVVPTVDEYQARRAADADARQAPAASTLIVAYGHWLGACRSAWRFVDRTNHNPFRVQNSHRHMLTRHDSYTPRECLDAIVRFHDRFGVWPTQWEFIEWGKIERRAARRSGAPDPRIPSGLPLFTAFGTFPLAVVAAQRSVPPTARADGDAGAASPDVRGGPPAPRRPCE